MFQILGSYKQVSISLGLPPMHSCSPMHSKNLRGVVDFDQSSDPPSPRASHLRCESHHSSRLDRDPARIIEEVYYAPSGPSLCRTL